MHTHKLPVVTHHTQMTCDMLQAVHSLQHFLGHLAYIHTNTSFEDGCIKQLTVIFVFFQEVEEPVRCFAGRIQYTVWRRCGRWRGGAWDWWKQRRRWRRWKRWRRWRRWTQQQSGSGHNSGRPAGPLPAAADCGCSTAHQVRLCGATQWNQWAGSPLVLHVTNLNKKKYQIQSSRVAFLGHAAL